MTRTDEEKPERLTLHPSQLIAGALAAVTGAALSARLGVAGTLAGTAAISIISGIASAVYEHSVKRTRVAVVTARARLAELQSTITTRRIEPDGTPAADELSDPEPAQPPFWSRIPRRRLMYAGAGALATFLLAIGIITSIELIHGKPLSGSGNGTTITRAFESGGSGHKQPSGPPASGTVPSPSDSPGPSAPQDSTTPSGQPSGSPSTQPSRSPAEQPSPTKSQQPSDSPSAPESSPPPQQSPSAAPTASDPAPTPSDVAPSN